jgi:hypothetical protein
LAAEDAHMAATTGAIPLRTMEILLILLILLNHVFL